MVLSADGCHKGTLARAAIVSRTSADNQGRRQMVGPSPPRSVFITRPSGG